jgi:hypothetical protein
MPPGSDVVGQQLPHAEDVIRLGLVELAQVGVERVQQRQTWGWS